MVIQRKLQQLPVRPLISQVLFLRFQKLPAPHSRSSRAGSLLDVSSILDEEELGQLKAVKNASESLAGVLGCSVVQSTDKDSLLSLSLFPRKKAKKDVLFSMPPEFDRRDHYLHRHRLNRELVPSQAKGMFRLKPSEWAKLTPERVPDEILLSRTSHLVKETS